MRLNADFSKRAMVIPREEAWVRSPETGVDRLMLDRIGDEVARATSIVRYAAGSSFSRHTHAMGEEFLVLDGVFSDESGNYSRGCYVRNPPGTGHAPFSEHGCRILVKLRQFEPDDQTPVVIDTLSSENWDQTGEDGVQRLHLYEFENERVSMMRLAAGASLPFDAVDGGLECFVVEGSVTIGSADLPAESWLRLPPGDSVTAIGNADSLLWLKTGHLPPRR